MLWVPKRTVSLRRFFLAPKTYAQNYGQEKIYNFTLKVFLSKPVSISFNDGQDTKFKVIYPSPAEPEFIPF